MKCDKLAIDLKFFMDSIDVIEDLKIFLSNFIKFNYEVYIISNISYDKTKKFLDSIGIFIDKHYTNVISILDFVIKNKKNFKINFFKSKDCHELDYNEFKDNSFEVAEFLGINTILFKDSTGIVSIV